MGRKVEIGFFENFLAPLWHLAVLVGYYKSVMASITIKKIAQTRRLLLYTHRRHITCQVSEQSLQFYRISYEKKAKELPEQAQLAEEMVENAR